MGLKDVKGWRGGAVEGHLGRTALQPMGALFNVWGAIRGVAPRQIFGLHLHGQ